jgi:cytochrome c-type biogenesis protein CcmH
MTAPPRQPRRRFLSAFFGLPGWIALAVAAIAVLAIGSYHPPASSQAARVSALDSIIKCPSCDNLSISQSDASTAVALRAVVAADVRAGESNAQIESYVEARYGAAILLSPTDPVVWIVPIVGLCGAACLLALFLWRRRRRPGADAGVDASAESDEDLVNAALAALDVDGVAPHA